MQGLQVCRGCTLLQLMLSTATRERVQHHSAAAIQACRKLGTHKASQETRQQSQHNSKSTATPHTLICCAVSTPRTSAGADSLAYHTMPGVHTHDGQREANRDVMRPTTCQHSSSQITRVSTNRTLNPSSTPPPPANLPQHSTGQLEGAASSACTTVCKP
jgi:hypothetical protein